jgi:hypothetical protein
MEERPKDLFPTVLMPEMQSLNKMVRQYSPLELFRSRGAMPFLSREDFMPVSSGRVFDRRSLLHFRARFC